MLNKMTRMLFKHPDGQITWPILIGYAAAITAILGIFMHSALSTIIIDDRVIMGWRLREMQFAIDSWNAGYPLLTGYDAAYYTDKFSSVDQAGRHGMRAIGISDDLGMYVLVPLLASWSGIHHPGELVRYAIFYSFLLLVFFYPFLFNKSFSSPGLTLLSPFFVIPGMAFVYVSGFSDVYWIQAWGVLALIPCIWWVLLTPWNPGKLWVLHGIVLAAGITSIFRSSAGLGVLLSCLVTLVLRLRYSKKLFTHGLLAMVIYFSSSQGIISLAADYRDSSLTKAGVTELREASHAFWHTAYIGLGWQNRTIPQFENIPLWGQKLIGYLDFGKPNPWGIVYKDEVALKKVITILPEAGYLTKEYNNVLRQEYFRNIQDNPIFFIKSIVLKFIASICLSIFGVINYFMLVISFVALAMGLWMKKGAIPLWTSGISRAETSILGYVILVPTMLIGVLQGLIAVPNPKYLLGLTASFYLAWVLVMAVFFQIVYERLATPQKDVKGFL